MFFLIFVFLETIAIPATAWQKHNYTKFHNLSDSEFSRLYLTLQLQDLSSHFPRKNYTIFKSMLNLLPPSFDSRDLWPSCIHPILNQVFFLFTPHIYLFFSIIAALVMQSQQLQSFLIVSVSPPKELIIRIYRLNISYHAIHGLMVVRGVGFIAPGFSLNCMEYPQMPAYHIFHGWVMNFHVISLIVKIIRNPLYIMPVLDLPIFLMIRNRLKSICLIMGQSKSDF